MRARLAPLFVFVVLAGCASVAPDGQTPAQALRCEEPCELALDVDDARSFEPAVAVDPTDARRIVAVSSDFAEGDSRWFSLVRSVDGGLTWTKTRFDAGPILAPCQGLFDPVIAFAPDGTLHLAGGAEAVVPPLDARVVDVFVATSRDGGATFDVTLVEAPPDGDPRACRSHREDVYVEPSPDAMLDCLGAGCDIVGIGRSADKPMIATGQDGTVALSWAGERGIHVATSRDGASWRQVAPLEASGDLRGPYNGAIAVLDDGALAMVFTDWRGSLEEDFVRGAWFARYDGAAWDVQLLDADASAYPVLAARDGVLAAAWPRGSINGPQTPLLSVSRDGGVSWSEPEALDAPAFAGVIHPTVAIDGRGVAWSGFFHHLADDANDYRVAAWDGAARGPLVVSRSPIGAHGPNLELGHYMGLAGLPAGVFAVWVSGDVPATDLRGAAVGLAS